MQQTQEPEAMPDWLRDTPDIALRLVIAVAIGFAIAWIYRRVVRRPDPELASFATTIVLLTALVAMTVLVIDNSVARAFSLVGALSIVRFRTVVEDTRDTAFVIFAVIAGMAAGVGNWALCAVGVPLVALVALVCARMTPGFAGAAAGGASATKLPLKLLVRLGAGHSARALLDAPLQKFLARQRLVRTTTARQGAALELTYEVELRGGTEPEALVRELNGIEGVQHVELGDA
ncbi:MAG: DUF4956 domain-containing protein [Myxococcales bacterium]|nr:DUF4956 domain-containing protein [Myxococcales bacterium]